MFVKRGKKLVKFFALMSLFVITISTFSFASDDPQPSDDGSGSSSSEETDFARSAFFKIQI